VLVLLKKTSRFIFVLILLCFISNGFSQNKSTIDSLESRYLSFNLSVSEQMSVLKVLANEHPKPNRSLFYSEKLLLLAKSQNDTENITRALQAKGNALTNKGDLSQAIKVYTEGVDLAKEINDIEDLGGFYISIANVYSVLDNRSNTIFYYKKAIEVLKNTDDKLLYTTAIEN